MNRIHTNDMKSIPPAAIQKRLVNLLAEELALAPHEIDVCRPLTQYGLDSMNAIVLAGDMEDWLEVEVPSTAAWDYPTVADLAAFLAAEVLARHDDTPTPAAPMRLAA